MAAEAACSAAGAALQSSMMGIQTCLTLLGPPPPPEAPASVAHRAHTAELDLLQARLASATTTLEGLVVPAVATRVKAKRRVAFTEKLRHHRELFDRYDLDRDQRLSRNEVIELAKGEYQIDVREELWNQVVPFLCPLWPQRSLGVPYDKFGRLLQRLAIERSEVRARQRRAEELERQARKLEELERRQQEIAQRAEHARVMCESADVLLLQALTGLKAAQEAAAPLLKDETLASAELRGAAVAVDSGMERPCEALAAVRTQLDDIASVCSGLSPADVPDIGKLRARLETEEARVKKLRAAAASARERAVVRAEEEEKSNKKRKAFAKLAQRYEELDEGESGDEF